MPDLLRHILACNNAVLPGGRVPLSLDGQHVGWMRPDVAGLVQRGAGVTQRRDGLDVPAWAFQPLMQDLGASGAFRLRGEAFDVRAVPGGLVLATVDRGALLLLGITAEGVHLNGVVERADGTWLWVARRAADKLLDPGKLDHIVAGGVPAGLTPLECLVKEAAEEAAVPFSLVAAAKPVGVLSYAMDRPEGLRRDRLHCYDLVLAEDFVPRPADGEVESFELWPLPHVLDRVRDTDDFKFNVNLVLIDLALRRGLIQGAEAGRLRAALDAPAA